MPDDFDPRRGAARDPAPVGLDALPLLTPPRSAWPALQASLDARRRPRWPAALLAVAAVLALVAVLPRLTEPPAAQDTRVAAPAVPAPVAAAAETAVLQALMAESAQLETLVAWSRDSQVESGVTAGLSDVLQARVESIDALLARPEADPEAQLPLWQERVLRLRQLAGLESTQQLLAASGQSDRGVPVLAF